MFELLLLIILGYFILVLFITIFVMFSPGYHFPRGSHAHRAHRRRRR